MTKCMYCCFRSRWGYHPEVGQCCDCKRILAFKR